ncbi:MAG: hypothetical protein VYA30_03770 [Myxococcota bacterium]|nr:hypothetical protein [Myxococcota bacterium]
MGPIAYMLIGMGIAAAIGLYLSNKAKQKKQRDAARQAAVSGANIKNDITRVGSGGVLAIPHFTPGETGTFETYVKSRNRYTQEGRGQWFELICECKGRNVLVEWQKEGNSLYVTAGYEDENPSIDRLNLTEADLIQFDEGQRQSFSWSGHTWTYEHSCERTYYENDGNSGEGFYAWEFSLPDETQYITIEKYEGDDGFEVYHQHRIDANKINVYDAGSA